MSGLIKHGNWTDHIAADTYWRSEEFEKLENYKNTVKPLLNKEIAKKNLLDFSNLLDKYKVKHLLFYGTLLGAYRDHDFIDHDLDTDLVYFNLPELVTVLTSSEFEELGFKVGRCQSAELISISRGDEFIDLYLYSKLDDEHYGMKGWQNVRISNHLLFPHSIIDFHGKRFRTVGKIVEYFEVTYGANWTTPIKEKHAEMV
ncbi:MAG: hypothetical protein P1U74_00590 [Legionellaceae bacterium]|nr:hypothetical protein [Legionellaceae bacterium]